MTDDFIPIAIGIDASEALKGRDQAVRCLSDITAAAEKAWAAMGGEGAIRATAGTFSSLNDALARTSTTTRTTADATVSYITNLARLDYQLGLITKTDLDYAQAEAKIGAALRSNIITADQAATRYAALNSRLDSASNSITRAGQGFHGSGILLQQFGYQAADVFAVMSSGGNVVGQLGIQVGQFLGFLGPWGALAGAAATGMGLLATGMLKTGSATADATKAERDYATALEQANALTMTAIELQRQKAEATRAATGTAIAQQRAQALADYQQAAGDRGGLLRQVEKQESKYGEGHADLALSRRLGEATARMDAAFDRLQTLEQARRDLESPKVGSPLWEQQNQGRIDTTREISEQIVARQGASREAAQQNAKALDQLLKAAEQGATAYRQSMRAADEYIDSLNNQRLAVGMTEREAEIFRAGLHQEAILRRGNIDLTSEQAKAQIRAAQESAAALHDDKARQGKRLSEDQVLSVASNFSPDVAYSLQVQNLTKYREALLAHGVTEEQITREIETYDLRRLQSGTSWTDGMQGALLQYQHDATNYSALAARGVSSGMSAMENALVGISTGTQSASQAFRTMAASILQDIARLQVQANVTGPLSGMLSGMVNNMFGSSAVTYAPNWNSTVGLGASYDQQAMQLTTPFADGGIMTQFGKVPLRTYSAGGIATSPQAAIYGEGSVPEAFVPVPSGKIPVEMRGPTLSPRAEQGGGGSQVNQTISVTIHQQPGEDQDALIGRLQSQLFPQMAALADAKATQKINGLIDQVNRGGKMAQTFGRR